MAASERWKYLVITVKASLGGLLSGRGACDARLQTELDQHGMLGWELVQVIKDPHGSRLIFKKAM
jgi:hypothetical protein